VIGARVITQQNESRGKIEDIVIDADAGRIAYAVLSFDPVMLPDCVTNLLFAQIPAQTGTGGIAGFALLTTPQLNKQCEADCDED
jgi:hypothetical protein